MYMTEGFTSSGDSVKPSAIFAKYSTGGKYAVENSMALVDGSLLVGVVGLYDTSLGILDEVEDLLFLF